MSDFFHGTTLDAALSMMKVGVDLYHPRKSDPGDFGLGFYLTGDIVRARAYGKAILIAALDMSEYAYIPSPYEPDDSKAGKLFRELAFAEDGNMRTCYSGFSKEQRQQISVEIRDKFLSWGWKGIRSDYSGGEIACFDLATIKKLTLKSVI